MEWNVLFMGPVGAGKSRAVRTISDIHVVDTDMAATDEVAKIKPQTTVAMDVGVLNLAEGDKLRVMGAPGQDRFDFMWDILLMQCRAAVLFLNHANPDPVADLEHYLSAMESRVIGRCLPLVVAVTHVDVNPTRPLHVYAEHLQARACRLMHVQPPVFQIDARDKGQVRAVLAALTGLLEMSERFPRGQRRGAAP